MGITKREQLQSWNNDEHIDLVATLGNMLKQEEHLKMEKFIETMPTIIQTHLIIEPNWAEVTRKAKNLEHFIQICHPLATAPPIITGGGAVSSLYSHITQSHIRAFLSRVCSNNSVVSFVTSFMLPSLV